MKLIKEDDKLFHFQTPDGEFKVVKKGLSKAAVDKINQIKSAGSPQKFADGGEAHPLDPDKAKPFAQSFSPTSSDQAMTQAVQHPIDSLSKVLHFKNGGEVPHYFDGTPPGGVPFPKDSTSTQTVAQNDAQLDRGLSVGDPNSDPINPGQPDISSNRSPASVDPATTALSPYDLNYESGSFFPTSLPPEQAAAAQTRTALPPKQALMTVDPTSGQISMPASDAAVSTKPKSAADIAALVGSQGSLAAAPSQKAGNGLAGQLDNSLQSYMNSQNSIANTKADSDTANAARLGKFMDDSQTYLKTQQASQAEIEDENAQISKDVANGKIDPNRFMNNKSTANTIGTAISILFSGLGAGAHGTNMAMSVLQDQINKDIDAQKSDIGNKQNLLTQNLHRLGNLQAATAATQAQRYAMLQGQIQQQAYQDGSQNALDQANMLNQQIQIQMQPLHMKLAQYDAYSKLSQDPNIDPVTKAMINPNLTPAMRTLAVKNAQAQKVGAAQKQQILDLFDKVNTDKDVTNPVSLFKTPASVTGMEDAIAPYAHGLGIRQVPARKEFASAFMKQRGDTPDQVRQRKNNLANMIDLENMKKQNGVGGPIFPAAGQADEGDE